MFIINLINYYLKSYFLNQIFKHEYGLLLLFAPQAIVLAAGLLYGLIYKQSSIKSFNSLSVSRIPNWESYSYLLKLNFKWSIGFCLSMFTSIGATSLYSG